MSITLEANRELFTSIWRIFASEVGRINREHGFWSEDPNKGEMIALMHAELSEALEALRHGNPPDSHCPQHTNLAVELADCVIRIMHFDSRFELGVGAALVAKVAFNEGREFRHGKLF